MKKFSILLVAASLFFISSMDAGISRRSKKPLVEIVPKMNFFIKSDLEVDIGGDVIFNPSDRLGFRCNFADIHIAGGTVFFLNYSLLYPTFDALIYMQSQGIQPYIHAGLGFVSHNGSILTLKGGAGFDFDIDRNTCFFVEPGLLIMSVSNHNSDTDIYFFISGGIKFGVIK
ncbi:MAG: hypothetical protein IMY70_01830 [Bacteroidetes bacterium]|nr:hypothetical protein [Bacteroidota bacterium]